MRKGLCEERCANLHVRLDGEEPESADSLHEPFFCKVSAFLIALVAVLPFAGCDDALAPKAADRRREEMEQKAQMEKEAARAREEKAELVAAIKASVKERKKQLEPRLSEVETRVAAVKTDLDGLGKAIATAMGKKTASGEAPKHETKVLNVLKDETVNAFAIKYLGGDFSAAREMFISDVRNGRAEEARYRKAIEAADSAYESSYAQTKDWNSQTREQRDAEIARLRSEIARLESQRRSARKEVESLTKHRMIGSRRQERERAEKGVVLSGKMGDVESEIAKKRKQLDFLTNPANPVGVEYGAARSERSIRDNADHAHKRRLEDIERTMKPKRLLSDIIAACEAETFGKLQKTMTAKIEADGKEVSEIRDTLTKLGSIETTLPLAEMQDLRNIRKQLLTL